MLHATFFLLLLLLLLLLFLSSFSIHTAVEFRSSNFYMVQSCGKTDCDCDPPENYCILHLNFLLRQKNTHTHKDNVKSFLDKSQWKTYFFRVFRLKRLDSVCVQNKLLSTFEFKCNARKTCKYWLLFFFVQHKERKMYFFS